ncbi:MAG: glycosyltransferase family 2 protein [Acidimicrobiia bacterium]
MSVIVPAHDEEATIERCLRSLLEGAAEGEVEVVVACNGCTDRTEEIASGFGPPVTVVATDVASKRAALNLGDAAATGFPRFYLDADVGLTVDGLRKVAAALEGGGALVAAPALALDAHRSSPIVRSYYRFFARLPSVAGDVAGRGVYALSEEGRHRFGEFPDVTGDDHFIRSSFPPEARVTVPEVTSHVEAPRRFSALVRRKARILAGNREVEELLGAPPGAQRRGGGLRAVLRDEPARVVDLPAYLLVGVAARALCAWAALRGRPIAWGRDDSRG